MDRQKRKQFALAAATALGVRVLIFFLLLLLILLLVLLAFACCTFAHADGAVYLANIRIVVCSTRPVMPPRATAIVVIVHVGFRHIHSLSSDDGR